MPVEELPRPSVSLRSRQWRVGTLTYGIGGLAALFFWLLWGDFAWNLKERAVGSVVQLLLKKFGASDAVVALLIGALPQAISILWGPIIGSLSARHRGRWGRRLPFLLVPTPLAVAAMFGLAFSPEIGRHLHFILGKSLPDPSAATVIVIGLLWGFFEVTVTIINAVFAALINDVVPHRVIGRFFGLFRAVSLIAGILFFFSAMGKAEADYKFIFIGLALLYGVGFTSMCLMVKEGEYPPPPPQVGNGLVSHFAAIWSFFRECFGQPYYLWVFASVSLGWVAFTPANLFNLFFAKSVDMSVDAYGKYIALTFFCSLILAYPLGILADRFHTLRMGLVTIALYVLVTLWGGLFATTTGTFAIALVAHGVVSGAWMTSTAAIGQMLLPKPKFGQFASAMNVVTALGTMIVGPLVGELLDHTGNVYRDAYLASSGLAFLGLLSGIVLYRQFLRLGGPHYYVAPE